MLKPNCEKEMLMQKVQATGFALYEANLYLNTHPCDPVALAAAREYTEAYCKAVELYNKKVGPMTAAAAAEDCACDCWSWLDQPWPWELC